MASVDDLPTKKELLEDSGKSNSNSPSLSKPPTVPEASGKVHPVGIRPCQQVLTAMGKVVKGLPPGHSATFKV